MIDSARALTVEAPDYPARLADVHNAPEPLWMLGDWRPASRAVAIVGARASTRRGLDLSGAIARALARRGIDVISGGALGVDAAAHRGAVEAGGHTVAVLGTGIDIVYPMRNAELFAEIVARGGALVTQFPPGTGPHIHTFPIRNRVIAALAEMVIVV